MAKNQEIWWCVRGDESQSLSKPDENVRCSNNPLDPCFGGTRYALGNTGDIILYDGRLAVYKHSLDLIFYLIANQDENELMINAALSAFSDAVHMLLRNQVEKRAVLENLDLVLLCLDETIDEGYVISHSSYRSPPLSPCC